MTRPDADRSATRLAGAGLLPFVLGAALAWIVRPDALPYVTEALSAYAAMVLAVLGGVHWALGWRAPAPEPARFVWGSALPLLAWVAGLMRPHAGLVLHGLLLIAAYAIDRKVYPRHGLAPWLTLRFRTSMLAALCCFIGAAGL